MRNESESVHFTHLKTPSCLKVHVYEKGNRAPVKALFQPKSTDTCLIFPQNRMLWVFIRSASARHF